MLTRTQAKLQLEYFKNHENREKEEERKILEAIDRIKKYLDDIDNLVNSCCWCHKRNNKIIKIYELYEYMLSNETKQDLFIPSFSKYPKFITILLEKNHSLKHELLCIIKKETIHEYHEKQKELMSKLNEMKDYLEENMVISENPTQTPLRRSVRLMEKGTQ